MKVRSILSIAALMSALAVPGLAIAQEEHMIGSKAVPADQVEAVQAKCDELRKAAPAESTTTPAESTPTPAPAESEAPAAEPSEPSEPSTEGWSADGTTIDLEKLTIALCDEGKFTATAM